MKMIRKVTFRVVLLILPILIPSYLASTDHAKKQQAFSDYVKAHEIQWKNADKAVFVMGDLLTGKTTLTLMLTNAKLKAIKGGGNLFQISDEHNKINNARVSGHPKNVIPELMIDESTNTAYFDCPGFGFDNYAADLASAYTVLGQLKRTKAVKFMFTIPYNTNFQNLAGYITRLFLKLNKYIGAISLVVTNIPHYLDDAMVMNRIVSDLEEYKKSRPENKELVDAFLTKHNGVYSKIVISRKPTREGPLSDDWIKSQKAPIERVLNSLQYVTTEDGDFDHFNYQGNLEHLKFYYIFDRIMNDVDRSFSVNVIKKFVLNEEKKLSQSLRKERTFMEKVHKMLSELMTSDLTPTKFEYQLGSILEQLSIDISGDGLEKALDYFDLFEIMEEQFNEKSYSYELSYKISKEMKDLMAYVENSVDWYKFLNDLHDKLSSYDYQKLTQSNQDLAPMGAEVLRKEEQAVSELNIKQIFDQVDRKYYDRIKNLLVNTYKMKLFQSVWQQAMQATSLDCQKTNLLVIGYNVQLRSVFQRDCFKDVQHLQVFAMNKVFIDTDISKHMTNKLIDVAIIAPSWQIIDIGTERNRILDMNGTDGKGLTGKAGDSQERGDVDAPVHLLKRADNGKNGEPGEAGGQFLAIGQSIVGKLHLEVFANGGQGGSGQDGGNGLYSTVTYDR